MGAARKKGGGGGGREGDTRRERLGLGLIRLIKPDSQGGFICSQCIFPLEFSKLFLSFKTIANSKRQIWRLCAGAAYEFVGLITLFNSYLAFSFFHFSKTTLLRLGFMFRFKRQTSHVMNVMLTRKNLLFSLIYIRLGTDARRLKQA